MREKGYGVRQYSFTGLDGLVQDGSDFNVLNPGKTLPETLPICAEKRFYGQPLLLQEVLKRAKHGIVRAVADAHLK